MNRRVFAATLSVLLLTVPAAHSLKADAPVYTVEDLGTTSDGLVPTVTGMNASGQVSGYVVLDPLDPSKSRAVRFTNGLGWKYLPGLDSVNSVATAINASGDLTGYYTTADGVRAFRYVDGPGVTTIPLLDGSSVGYGFAIAANGDVVGYALMDDFSTRAWRAGPAQNPVVLSNLADVAATACGLNESGQVVGSLVTADGNQHAFRLEADGSVTDLDTLEGPLGTSAACAIDVDGRVGGYSSIEGANHAFLSTGGLPIDINPSGSLFSMAEAISNGVAVGTFVTSTSAQRAFIHTDVDGTSDLNDHLASGSGWVLMDATAVNAGGQIAGLGVFGGGLRAFRLTPAASADTTPPVIGEVRATPPTIGPPNGAFVPVTVAVSASDDSGDTPVCALSSITGGREGDAVITPPLSATLRATGGRTYTLHVTCSDAAGNASEGSVDVEVPRDTTAPTITALSVSPDYIWPPNNKMVTVTVSVSATDDVDATPTCGLASITGAPADAVITGRFTASVRANKDAVYTLQVGCGDQAGNRARATVSVKVTKDPPIAAANGKK
jgi:probable HAF family extracellular repeat protein